MTAPSSGDRLLAPWLRSITSLHPDRIHDELREVVRSLGASESHLFLIDLSQRILRQIDRPGVELALHGTAAGEAFRTQRPVGPDSENRLHLPIQSSGRIGVLTVTADEFSPDLLTSLEAVAAVAGELIASRALVGDGLEVRRRSEVPSLAAEMRWMMLPPLSFTTDGWAVAGILEPAYEIAGDTFDYGTNGNIVHFAIFDAVGHGMEASRMASLAVASYRHSRRVGLELAATLTAIDDVILDQFGNSRFVTAQVGQLDTTSGHLKVLSAGHPPPLRIGKEGTASVMPFVPHPPIGLGLLPGEESSVVLEAGDALLFYSDGVTESRSSSGEFFGLDRLAKRFTELVRSGETAAELTRLLIHDVLTHETGPLRDDASLLYIRWDGSPAYPAEPRMRNVRDPA